jgi:hypothetical protein
MWDHVAQPGETLWLISQRFNKNLYEIFRLNPQIRDKAKIWPGTIVHMPDPPPQGDVIVGPITFSSPGPKAFDIISVPGKYFVSKADPASPAGRGAKTENGRLWRQELALGGRADIGIAGLASWNTITFGFNNPTIAAVMTLAALSENFAGPDGIRLVFQITGIAAGDTVLVAYDSGQPFASMQVSVSGAVAANAAYVDDFQDFAYDPEYNAENGNRSTTIAVRYYDDVVVPIDINTISDGTMVPDGQTRRSGAGGRLYPLILNAATTPRLHAAKRQVHEILEAMLYDDVRMQLLNATTQIAFYVTLYQFAIGAQGAFAIIGRSGVRSLMRKVVELPEALRAFLARAGAKEAVLTEAEKQAINAIRAIPEFSKLTTEEILAIRYYSDMGYAEINAALRYGGGSAKTQATIKALLSGLEKLPGYSGQLMRTESRAVADAAADYVAGQPYVPGGMYSANVGGAVRGLGGNVSITIRAIGKNGKSIAQAAVHAGKGLEDEILFPPGTKFMCESVQRLGELSW